MELTGKCKKAFEKWLLIWLKENIAWDCENPTKEDVNHFYKFPFSMQFGVLVDYFISVDLLINIYGLDVFRYKLWDGEKLMVYGKDKRFNKIQEARTEAIKKANEIFNSNF